MPTSRHMKVKTYHNDFDIRAIKFQTLSKIFSILITEALIKWLKGVCVCVKKWLVVKIGKVSDAFISFLFERYECWIKIAKTLDAHKLGFLPWNLF